MGNFTLHFSFFFFVLIVQQKETFLIEVNETLTVKQL